MTVTALILNIVISILSLAWGYSAAGFDSISIWIIFFGALWLISQWRGWKWFSALGLFLSLLAAMIGLWLNLIVGWMFSSAIFALFAWDMTEFREKIYFMPSGEDIKGMERRHLARVSFLALGGLLFSSLLMLLRAQFSFEWWVLLGFVILLGLLQLPAWFRK